MNKSKKGWNGKQPNKERRERVIQRLTDQLKRGVKPTKKTGQLIPLTPDDVKRINSEIEILKHRI
jgi:hypothetical protein